MSEYISICFYDTHPVKQTSSQDEFHQKSPESDELIERNHGKERHPRHLKLHKPSQTVSHKLPVQLPVTNFTIHTACKATATTCSFSSFLVQMLSGSNGPLALCLKTGSRRTAKTGLGLGLDYVSLWESQVRKLSESSLRSTMHVGDPHFFATHQCVFLETSIFSIKIDHNTFETLNWSSGRPSWIQDTRQIQRKNGQEMWCGSTGQRKAVHSMSMKMCPFWNANRNYHFHVWAKLEPTSGISMSHAAWSKDQKTEMLYPKNMRRYSAVHVWHNIT